jgi:ribosome-associated translation inhibitor RaiA
MQVPLQIDFHGIEPSGFIERRVRERANKLVRFNDRIVGCRVVVEAPHHHHRHGNLYAVQITVHVPGAMLIVGRDPARNRAHADVYVAIRDAFNAAERRLDERSRNPRRRRPEKWATGAEPEAASRSA